MSGVPESAGKYALAFSKSIPENFRLRISATENALQCLVHPKDCSGNIYAGISIEFDSLMHVDAEKTGSLEGKLAAGKVAKHLIRCSPRTVIEELVP